MIARTAPPSGVTPQPPPRTSALHRILMLFVPDKAANITGGALVVLTFVAGVLEMLSRQYATAPLYFYFSIGMLTFLIGMKYLALHANLQVAHSSHAILVNHIQQHRSADRRLLHAPKPQEDTVKTERAEMIEALSDLRESLKNIPPNTTLHAKYSASVEWMERALKNQAI